MPGLGRAKAALDARDHGVLDHLAGDAGRRCRPGDDLAVAGVDGEQHADGRAVAAADLEVVGAPAHVRAERHDDAVVGPRGPPAGVGLQGEAVGA